MRLICIAILFVLLAGCSSIPADSANVKQVPPERLLAFQQPVEGGGQITVNRDIGMIGGGCYLALSIDRKVSARIGIGEEAHFQVSAGATSLALVLTSKMIHCAVKADCTVNCLLRCKAALLNISTLSARRRVALG